MFYCSFCEKETCYTAKFCDITCRKIKNICNVYGFEEVLEVLNKVCLRNEKQRQYKIDIKLKEDIEKKAGYFQKPAEGDETYMKPKTRSKTT
tara:strand:- start:6821 stop:7096 length:276 start_codon:yes stop_codon:yes gene_type:complete